jgi:hypothetical protein
MWTATCSNAGEVPQVEFSAFSTESGYDFLYIYSGEAAVGTADEELSGGSSWSPFIPDPQVPTRTGEFVSNSLTLRFVSDGSVQKTGFTASFSCIDASTIVEPVPDPCEGDGLSFVDSPVDPTLPPRLSTGGAYTSRTNCKWTVKCTAIGGATMVPYLEFASFDTEGNFDWVDIYNGNSVDDERLEHLSGSFTDEIDDNPGVVLVAWGTGSSLFINLNSDGSVNKDGFEADFTCVDLASLVPPPPMPCTTGVALVDGVDDDDPTVGAIASTVDSNGKYSSNQDCTWALSCSDPEKRAVLTFSAFYTERRYDYVYIHYGEVSDAPAYTLHGELQPPDNLPSDGLWGDKPAFLAESAAGFTVNFDSDGSANKAGFIADFECIAPSEFGLPPPMPCTTGIVMVDGVSTTDGSDGPATTVTTDGSYAAGASCSWALSCSDTTLSPILTFTEFHTEGGYDFLNLYMGDAMEGDVALSLHGSGVPAPVVADGPALFVSLVSSSSWRGGGSGFTGTFECIDPATYTPPPPTACSVGVVGGAGIALVDSGSLSPDTEVPTCDERGYSWNSVDEDAAACAGVTGSDLDTATACDLVMRAADSTEPACEWAAGKYFSHAECTWEASCSDTSLVAYLEFTSFDIYSGWSVSDKLDIYKGVKSEDTLAATLYGDEIPDPVAGDVGGIITANFVSDGTTAGAGFDATFTCVTPESLGPPPPPDPCVGPGLPLEDEGTVDLSGTYSSRHDCTWTLSCSDPTFSPQLVFTAFHTENNYDHLDIYEGEASPPCNSPGCLRFNGDMSDSLPLIPVFDAGPLTLEFNADGSVQKDGFTATFTCIDKATLPTPPPSNDPCDVGGISVVDSGSIGVTEHTGRNDDCRWAITCSDATFSPVLTFTAFHTQANTDYVNVYNGPTQDTGLKFVNGIEMSLHGLTVPAAISNGEYSMPDGSDGAFGMLVQFTSGGFLYGPGRLRSFKRP